MPEVKVVYFDLYGRGETIRLILKHAGIQFEDNRITSPFVDSTDWLKVKPTIPSGKVPYIVWDGEQIGESMAICRFIAKKTNLAGRSNTESAMIDEMIDSIQDINAEMYKVLFEPDEDKKKVMQQSFAESVLPTRLGNIDRRMRQSGGQFLANNALSWADIHFFQTVFNLRMTLPRLLLDFPRLDDLVDRVASLPNIAKWVKDRPTCSL